MRGKSECDRNRKGMLSGGSDVLQGSMSATSSSSDAVPGVPSATDTAACTVV